MIMDDKVTLLSFWPSSYGMRVQIALAEKGIDYEYIEEDIPNKSSLLLQMNPIHRKVPVLIHNGKSICESLNIVEYIDEVWNDKSPLLPSDPYSRAQAKFWGNYIDKMYVSGEIILIKKGEEQEVGTKEFVQGLKIMEGELGEKTYFWGDNFGFVDIALISSGCWFYALGTYGNFNLENEFPKLSAWVKKCMERESVSKSLPHPHKVYDLAQQIRKRRGIE